jgi:succinoglycan biosynthesis transport protein ExoP
MSDSENRQPEKPQSPDYLRVIRERAWIIILTMVVVVGVTMFLSYRAIPEYQASSSLFFQPNTLDRALFGAQVFPDSNQPRDVETAAKLVKVDQVAQAVKKQLGTPLSTGQLLGMIGVTTSSADNLVQIGATSTDPKLAADVANAFAQQFVLFRQNADRETVAAARQLVKQQLDGLSPTEAAGSYGLMLKDKYESLQILEAMQTGGFKVVQNAAPASSPFSPRPTRSGILALGVGLVVGLGLALLVEYGDKRIRDVNTLERYAGMPVLATVPDVGGRWRWLPGRGDSDRAVGLASDPILLESFRILRSSLKYFGMDEGGRGIKTILVTSGTSGEGKTVTAINLALSLTIAGSRVVLIDADLRHPKLAEHLGLHGDAGLSTVLTEDMRFIDALQPVNVPAFVPEEIRERLAAPQGAAAASALFCLASGPLQPNPSEVLGPDRVEALLADLAADTMIDYVVIDSAPVLSVADALAIAPKVDAVLIAARLNRVTRDEVQRVNEQLSRSGARVIGMVVGGARLKPSTYQKRGYAAPAKSYR